MAFWKQDAISVNGFNEDFKGWGREDSEFVCRLLNEGVQKQDLLFGGIAYHLDHVLLSRQNLPTNDAILCRTIKNKSTWCENGINQYL